MTCPFFREHLHKSKHTGRKEKSERKCKTASEKEIHVIHVMQGIHVIHVIVVIRFVFCICEIININKGNLYQIIDLVV